MSLVNNKYDLDRCHCTVDWCILCYYYVVALTSGRIIPSIVFLNDLQLEIQQQQCTV